MNSVNFFRSVSHGLEKMNRYVIVGAVGLGLTLLSSVFSW